MTTTTSADFGDRVRSVLAELPPSVNESAEEIDVIWVHGFGFPAYRGGPMHHADRLGLPTLLGRLRHYAATVGPEYFAPAPLIEELAAAGRGFYG